MRKRLLVSAVCAMAIAVIVVTWIALRSQSPAWLARLEPGLTEAEVQTIMTADGPMSASECWFTDEIQHWGKDGWSLWLYYKNGRVTRFHVSERMRTNTP
jgi:hypothetical protein